MMLYDNEICYDVIMMMSCIVQYENDFYDIHDATL